MKTQAIKNHKAAVTAARAALATARVDLERAQKAANGTDDMQARRNQLTARRVEALGAAFVGGTDSQQATAEIDREIEAHDAKAADLERQRDAARAAVTLCERRISEAVDVLREVSVEQVTAALEAAREDAALKAARFTEAARGLNTSAGEWLAASRVASTLARVITGRLGAEVEVASDAIFKMEIPALHNSGGFVASPGLSKEGAAAESAAWDAAVEKLAEAGVDVFGTCLAKPRAPVEESEPRPVTITRLIPDPSGNGKTIATVERADATMREDDGPGMKRVLVG